MPAKRKELGDYKTIIAEYFKEHKNTTYKLNKTGLNLALGISRSDIYHWRHREAKKWQKEFMFEYDKACSKIANYLLKNTMKDPKYQWAYLRACFPEQFEDLSINNNQDTEDSNNNIQIIIGADREIEENE